MGRVSPVIRLVVADDQAVVRGGLRLIFESQPDFTVVGEAGDGSAALDVVRSLAPDVVLMDIRMPVLDGIAATARIAKAGLPTQVLILTTYGLDEYVFEALRAGAAGFLLKTEAPERLVEGVRAVHRGEALLAPEITRRLIDRYVADGALGERAQPSLAQLTEREHEVLRLLARGLSNAEIADALVVSPGTVKTHVAHLLAKLGLRDRVQAVVFAYEAGVVARGDRA
jgi:DNA-binding NarL/FixJ family response regulator